MMIMRTIISFMIILIAGIDEYLVFTSNVLLWGTMMKWDAKKIGFACCFQCY